MRAIAALLATTAALLAGASALAQTGADYPRDAVHMVVPFPAGGPADILARIVGQSLSDRWHQPIVIENKPGANTAVAAAHVAHMPADGYTLFVVMDVTMVLNPLTMSSLPYNPGKDFTPITVMSKNTSLLSVRAEDGPTSIQDLIARAKAHPGALNFGAGIITTRLAGELFNRVTGISVQYVPFQGSPPTVQGLLSHSVDYIIDGAATSLPLIQAGQLRALAKLNDGPVQALPQLRTLAKEANAPALDDVSTWIGLVAPAGTPMPIVEKIHRDVNAILTDPDMLDKLHKAGINPATSTPAEFRDFIGKETERWGKVIAETGIQLN